MVAKVIVFLFFLHPVETIVYILVTFLGRRIRHNYLTQSQYLSHNNTNALLKVVHEVVTTNHLTYKLMLIDLRLQSLFYIIYNLNPRNLIMRVI